MIKGEIKVIHVMHLEDRPFQMIRLKQKTIELRLCDEKRKTIKKGDTIQFIHKTKLEHIFVTVEEVIQYKDFDSLYKDYSKESMGYQKDEVANPSDMLSYYSENDILNYGVMAIKIAIMTS